MAGVWTSADLVTTMLTRLWTNPNLLLVVHWRSSAEVAAACCGSLADP
ncbi:MAG TPA: hypothetical protein VJ976_11040 [Ornithinimicrobium sp.]|nr:hypothetical protein [Ornithinimicrobium sp.]HKJ12907.1 hypothetical protein [Ornithinimicrobium sp.]